MSINRDGVKGSPRSWLVVTVIDPEAAERGVGQESKW